MAHRVARLGVGDEGLRARRLPVHRPAELLGGHQHRDVFGIDRGLHAEGAAHVLGDHPQFLVRHAHDRGRLAAQGVGALRAGVQRIAIACRVVVAGGAARLHRRHHQALMGDGHARDMRRLVDDVVDRALVLRVLGPSRPVDDEIARRLRMKLRVRLHGGVEIDHRRQLLVFHLHLLGGVQRLGGGFRHHHGDRIADMHRPSRRERRAERHHHLGAAAADDGRVARDAADAGRLDVLAREHRQHALGGARGVRLHRDDAGVRVRRAHERGIGLVRQPRVVDETAGAADERVVLDARFVLGAGGENRVHAGLSAWGAGAGSQPTDYGETGARVTPPAAALPVRLSGSAARPVGGRIADRFATPSARDNPE